MINVIFQQRKYVLAMTNGNGICFHTEDDISCLSYCTSLVSQDFNYSNFPFLFGGI